MNKRNTTRKRGGGNDPRCGCDMQAGWPKSLVENIPYPATGGGCPVPDACPFPGTGYCEFYAKGGAYGNHYGEPAYLLPKLRGGATICPFTQKRRLFKKQAGGSCGGSCGLMPLGQTGGGCGCGLPTFRGGKYRATKKNRNALRKYKQGKSIGFTMTSSLKAKGLIPRTSKAYRGKKIVSPKYR